MTTVTEDYVSFEVAKLLKEKGFDEPTWTCYIEHEIYHYEYASSNSELIDGVISAPTHQAAMKWLRKRYNIMISPYASSLGYYFEIFDLTNRDITGCKPLYKVGISNKEDFLPTCEQACEAAIKYYLEKLILNNYGNN